MNAHSTAAHKVMNVTPPVDSSANCGAFSLKASGSSPHRPSPSMLSVSNPAESRYEHRVDGIPASDDDAEIGGAHPEAPRIEGRGVP